MRGAPPKSQRNAGHPLNKYKAPAELAYSGDDVAQAEAKTWLPPDCSIWRGNFKALWAAHVKHHPRIQELWSDHGGSSKEAMLECVRRCWRLWLSDKCLPESACPIKGLLSAA